MADQKQIVDVSQTPTPMIDRSAPGQEAKIPMNLLPVEQVQVEDNPTEQQLEQVPVEAPSTETPIVAPPPMSPDID